MTLESEHRERNTWGDNGNMTLKRVKMCQSLGNEMYNDANSPGLLKCQLSDAQLTQLRTFIAKLDSED